MSRSASPPLVVVVALYDRVVDSWQVLDNASREGLLLVASRSPGGAVQVVEAAAWRDLLAFVR